MRKSLKGSRRPTSTTTRSPSCPESFSTVTRWVTPSASASSSHRTLFIRATLSTSGEKIYIVISCWRPKHYYCNCQWLKPNPFSRHSYIYYEEMQEKSFPIRAVFDLQTNFIVKFSENSKSKSISWVWNDGPLDIFTASKNTHLQIRFRAPSQRPDAGEVLLGRREVGRGGRVVGARGHRRWLGNSVIAFLKIAQAWDRT